MSESEKTPTPTASEQPQAAEQQKPGCADADCCPFGPKIPGYPCLGLIPVRHPKTGEMSRAVCVFCIAATQLARLSIPATGKKGIIPAGPMTFPGLLGKPN